MQLCLPAQRISAVLKIAHDMPFGSHMAFRRTNDRIALSFFFPGQRSRVKDYCMRCETCQLFSPARRNDLNVIEPIPRDAPPFGHLVFTIQYNTNKNLYGAAYNINRPAAPYNEYGKKARMRK